MLDSILKEILLQIKFCENVCFTNLKRDCENVTLAAQTHALLLKWERQENIQGVQNSM